MTAKEKAKEIILKLHPYTAGLCSDYEINCAIVLVDEALKLCRFFNDNEGTTFGKEKFYEQVKEELQKMQQTRWEITYDNRTKLIKE